MDIIRGNNILTVRVSPGMVEGLRINMQDTISLPVFSNQDLYASFIANMMDDFVLFAILFILEVIMTFIKLCANRFKAKTLVASIQTLQILTRYNLILMLFAINIGDIIFFSIVFLRSSQLETSRDSADLYICLVMLSACIIFLMMTAYLINCAKEAKQKDEKIKSSENFDDFKSDWRDFQVLFGGGDTSSKLSESFFLIYIARLTLPMIIAATLESTALAQVILYLLINLAMIAYIFVKKPIKSKINNLNVALIELIMLGINICAVCLAAFDTSADRENISQSSIDTISKAIIVLSFSIDVVAVSFLTVKVVLVIVKAFQLRKEVSKQERAAWLQLLFIPLQQGCLFFEEIQIDFIPSLRKVTSFKSETPPRIKSIPNIPELQTPPSLKRLSTPQKSMTPLTESNKSIEIIDIAKPQYVPVEDPIVIPMEQNTPLRVSELMNESPIKLETPMMSQEVEPFIIPERLLLHKKKVTAVPEPPKDLIEVFKKPEVRTKFALEELAIIDDSPYARQFTLKSSTIISAVNTVNTVNKKLKKRKETS